MRLPFALAGLCALSPCACSGSDQTVPPGQDPAAAAENVTYPSCTSTAPGPCLDTMSVGQGFTMPFYRNFSLSAPSTDVSSAVIVVHGADRDASNYFYTVLTAASQIGADTTTLIVAPRFQCSADDPPAGQVYWQCSGDDWAHGYGDASGAASPISSYGVVDQFVRALADKSNFPNLTQVVVTGLSAGGQLTQRYAATNGIDPVAGISLDYAVLSPSSYVYLDPNRLLPGGSCSETGGCSTSFAPVSGANCPDYDLYYYGLEQRSGYVAQKSADAIRAQYVARTVHYFVGSEDTLANAAGTDLDTSCEANVQGVDRVARAVNFWNAMTAEYRASHSLTVVPGCMHSRDCMYYAPQLRDALFPEVGDGG